MASLPGLVREQIDRAMRSVRQAFRAVGTRNTHGPSIGVQMQGLAGETVVGELAQHYGFTSAPLAGAEFIVLPIGGNSKHAVVIATEDARYRLKIQDGEVALYSDEGDHVHLKRGRVIEVETETLLVKASKKVRFETPMIEATGEYQGEGNIQSAADVIDQVRSMQADRLIYNGHQHGNSPTPTQQQ
ncbi:phage baseplate assembly protein V [Pseudomonas sp. P1B16]|uniref:phage baseplate assembly protein V n=1 Tax=Pseudomonas sp. P1B16 TaxID=2986074 RepID=UPI002A24B721|nr:phage baseplate assembly protein V [Pseudomonas sp. P1B16]WPM24899.1 phage baseplate assembly protein V [Pseudomonas sp. P1B16]